MRNLVEVVVNDFTQIDEGILLDLNVGLHVDLDTGGVHDAKIADVVLAVLADDHELRLPELLVIGNLIVVGFTFTDLEDTLSTINRDFEIFELFGVDCLKFHMELVRGCLVWQSVKSAALEINGSFKLAGRELTHTDVAQGTVNELVQAGVIGYREAGRKGLNSVRFQVESFGIGLDLILERVVTDT